jgi:hypothetical protein
MKTTLLALMAASACVADVDHESSITQADTLDPTGEGGTTTPPRDPRVPRYPGLRTARIDMDLVNVLLGLKLTGTKISIDATGSAPPLTDPSITKRVCSRPDGYNEDREFCLTLATGRVACLRGLDEAYPTTCSNVVVKHHSYISFSPTLKSTYPALTDYMTNIDTFRAYTWYGDIDITLNQIRAELDTGNTFFYAASDDKGALIGLRVLAGSPTPTAYCHHTSPIKWCPDIQLSNMSFALRLQHLGPSASDPTRIGFTTVDTVLGFDRNILSFPDWLADAFHDIDPRIRQRTEAKVREALEAPARHDTLERALDEITTLAARARDASFTDFGVIDEVTYYGGDLYVHYRAP